MKVATLILAYFLVGIVVTRWGLCSPERIERMHLGFAIAWPALVTIIIIAGPERCRRTRHAPAPAPGGTE
jgi:hypothetical protein